MSLLAEYRALERLVATKQSELETMKLDPRLSHDYEFERKLQELLAEYRFGVHNVLAILDREKPSPQHLQYAPSQSRTHRTVRQLKFYQNPYTGEVVETRTSKHRGLQQWIAMFGRDEVESWAKHWS